MENITILDPQKCIDVAKQGKKIAIFEINDDGKAIIKLSDIIFSFSHNFDKGATLIEPAMKYLKSNFNKGIRLEFLAELCQISPNYFSKKFSDCFGEGLIEYVTSMRLEHACRLLKTTNKTVVNIAADVGYVDCGYFNKLFKKKYGCTPIIYRKGNII